MIEFNDIDFGRPNRPEPMHHHHPKPEPWKPCPPPPFDPELKRVFDLAAHADHVAHKALDVASYANLDATAAKKLTEQTLAVLNKVSKVANEANLKSDQALTKIDLLKDQAIAILAELNKTQKGAGLAEDGSYVKDDSTNYIKDATSLADADKKLDAQLKSTSDSVDSLNEIVSGLNRDVNSLQNICANIIESAGFTEDGQLEGFDNSLIRSANSLSEAIERLAAKVSEISTQSRGAATVEELNEVKEQITGIEDSISDLERKDTDLQNQITNASEVAQTANTKVSAVERRVDLLDAKMDPTHALAEQANQRVGLVEARVDAIETDKVGSVVLENTGNLQYTLKVDGINAGTINIPEDQYLNQVTYNPETKQLIFKFINGSTVPVSIQDFVKEYTAGNGIRIEGSNIIADEYVAGPGLGRTDGNDPHELEFGIKIESNSQNILHATREDGLGIDIDALKAEIGGDDQLDCAGVVDCIMNSDTFNTWLNNKINQAVEAAMLWRIKQDDDRYIEPKNGKYVYVDGEIEATGAIYSGQD